MHGPSHGGNSSHSFSPSSSNSSHNFSFSSGGSYHRAPMPPRRIMFFGRPIIIATSFFNWVVPFIAFAIFAAIAIIMSSFSMFENKQQIDYIKEDAAIYQEIIDIATQEDEADDYYLFTITGIDFTPDEGIFKDGYTYYGYSYRQGNNLWVVANYVLTYEGLDYYQLFYYFVDENEQSIIGLTYAQYSETQVVNIDRLNIAYTTDGSNLSINADYSLDQNMEYFDYSDQYKISKTIVIIASIACAALLAGAITMFVMAVKKGKKEMAIKEETAAANIEKTQAETDAIRAETAKRNRVCEYCGCPIPDGEDVCPGCGSRH